MHLAKQARYRIHLESALSDFQIWATNVTALPKSLEQRVADARLRSSSGETTFARELARGFAGQQGIGVVVEGGTGWTTVVRGGLRLSIDSERLGDELTRIHAFPIENVRDMLEQIATIPASCMSGDDASEIRAWWIGMSDLEGVPADLGVRVAVSGEDFGGFWATYCVLDLISGEWQFARQDADFVGPASDPATGHPTTTYRGFVVSRRVTSPAMKVRR